ncbi:MAG: carbonic anhydrase [bacterium]
MTFCTSIHCMDGRIQEPIIKYLREKYGISYVDTITEPGPCKILAENEYKVSIDSIMKRIKISINKHGSKLIAVSGHYDCAGNPCDEEVQKKQIRGSVKHLKNNYPEIEIIGLWVDKTWKVHEVRSYKNLKGGK